MTLAALRPEEVEQMIADGAMLIDIRDPDEHARERIAGSISHPLARIEQLAPLSGPTIFHCRSGMRTHANATRLAAARAGSHCYVLTGGIDAWRSSGRATIVDARQPLEIMRQVQLVAGGMVLLGVILGFLVSPLLCASNLNSEAETEQKRKNRIELAFDKKMNQKMRDLVGERALPGKRRRHKPVTGKPLHIADQDAANG